MATIDFAKVGTEAEQALNATVLEVIQEVKNLDMNKLRADAARQPA